MTQPLFYFLIALASLLVGAGLMHLVIRQRAAPAAHAHVHDATELAVARENVRLQIEERRQLQARLDTIQSESERWRAALDDANNERALMGERASRVAPLETRLEDLEQRLSQGSTQSAQLGETISRLQAELEAERIAHTDSRSRATAETNVRLGTEAKLAVASDELARLSTQSAAEREHFTEKLAFIEEAKRNLTDQFKNLANDILEEKGKRFAEQNQSNLGALLNPLKQKLSEFQTKVEDVYVNESKDRSALTEQVKQLMGLNQVLSDEAKNLTTALKGSNKTQGNWGEMVLERLLEDCGLRNGHEFRTQDSHTQEDGRRFQPDVIVSLPEGRSLVIDAKMSLNAYETWATSDDGTVRETALKAHIASVRTHIKGLSAKDYQSIHQLKSLDFVLMFIPIESAFMAAVSHDRELHMDAWRHNVLLVSPSTLLFVLRTVSHLWRQEAQNRNAQEIAKRGAELYDRLCGFTVELEKIGQRLNQAQQSFQAARTRLSGNQGVIRKAEQLRELGVKPSRKLPADWGHASGRDDDAQEAGPVEVPLLESIDACTEQTDLTEASLVTDSVEAIQRQRPGRRVNPDSKLSRARKIYSAHIAGREPLDIKRIMVEALGVSPEVANTYFCKIRDSVEDTGQSNATDIPG